MSKRLSPHLPNISVVPQVMVWPQHCRLRNMTLFHMKRVQTRWANRTWLFWYHYLQSGKSTDQVWKLNSAKTEGRRAIRTRLGYQYIWSHTGRFGSVSIYILQQTLYSKICSSGLTSFSASHLCTIRKSSKYWAHLSSFLFSLSSYFLTCLWQLPHTSILELQCLPSIHFPFFLVVFNEIIQSVTMKTKYLPVCLTRNWSQWFAY